MEIGEPGPYAGVVHAEDGEVFGLDGVDVGFVGDSESASGQIVEALETVSDHLLWQRTRCKLTVAVIEISHGSIDRNVRNRLTVNGR